MHYSDLRLYLGSGDDSPCFFYVWGTKVIYSHIYIYVYIYIYIYIYEPNNLMGDLKISKSEINNRYIQLLDPDPRAKTKQHRFCMKKI